MSGLGLLLIYLKVNSQFRTVSFMPLSPGCQRNNCKCVPARLLASVIGKINSMSLGLGSVSRSMTQSLYVILNGRTSWYDRLELSDEASAELEF